MQTTESSELVLDPKYIAARYSRLKSQIETNTEKSLISVARVDRTVKELSKEYNIPIFSGSLPPQDSNDAIVFFFPSNI